MTTKSNVGRSQEELLSDMLERYTQLAVSPEQEQKFPVGPDSAIGLGYGVAEIRSLPASATESFCGVGNPWSLGDLREGQTVVDLGSGAGLDSILAVRRVGASGRVIGIDMNRDMVHKARRNAASLGLENVEFVNANIDRLPLEDESVDVAVSNGVFNLCIDKAKVLGEVYRVLRPGGRLQMADILLHDDVSPAEVAQKGTWSD